MRYTWIDEYLLGKEGVTKDLQKDWNWIRYQIGGKMFAAVCLGEQDEPYYITLKLEPLEGDFLRQQYEDIVPGYYMNKTHWNSIKPDGEVPDDLLKDLLDKSYAINQKGMKGCGECGNAPCEIWRKTKDPAYTEEEFERNIQENISVQGATNDIKKCFRYAEWKSQIFHSIFTYSLVALIDEIKPSVAFLLSSKLIFSQSSR